MKPTQLVELYDDFQKAVSWNVIWTGLEEIYRQLPPEDLCKSALSLRAWIDEKMRQAIQNAMDDANAEAGRRVLSADTENVGCDSQKPTEEKARPSAQKETWKGQKSKR